MKDICMSGEEQSRYSLVVNKRFEVKVRQFDMNYNVGIIFTNLLEETELKVIVGEQEAKLLLKALNGLFPDVLNEGQKESEE
jgi:hypothetical protein